MTWSAESLSTSKNGKKAISSRSDGKQPRKRPGNGNRIKDSADYSNLFTVLFCQAAIIGVIRAYTTVSYTIMRAIY